MDGFLLKIYSATQTVFTSREIAMLTGEKKADNLKAKLSYYVKQGDLVRLRRGLFARNQKFDVKECAVRICTPAYISLETVLAEEGVIFQYYASIFVTSYLSRDIVCAQSLISYKKIKDEILLNQKGLVNKGTYLQATKERAFLDRLYLSGDYHFDNLQSMDWEKCFELVTIYGKKSLTQKLNQYYKKYAQQK
ncbi:MAG: hypothetical protein WC823_01960 [Parcubacteria group bacterium]|jgi:hypothetical protein